MMRIPKKRLALLLGLIVFLFAGGFLLFLRQGKPGSLVVDCAYFRKLSTFDNGTIYLFLKNEGKRPARINKIILDDIPLPDLTLSELIDEGDMADSDLIPPLKVKEDDRVLWDYVYPNPIPPGKIAKIVIKYEFPPKKLINFVVEDAKGKKCRSIIQPRNNPLRFTYIGFNKDFNKIYLYLENQETTPLQIARVYINGQDATKDSFKPWEYLNPNEKKCIEVNFKTPLTKGEFIAAKVITTDGLATESLVRASSFFPITTDSGNPQPDLNLDNENYLANFSGNSYNKDISKNIIYDILDCPTHAHGTWRNAGRKAIARMIACYDNDLYHLTYMGICKGMQIRGTFAFSEIADVVKENPLTSERPQNLPFLKQHPTQILAQIIKEVSSPNPWYSIVSLIPDIRIEQFERRTPSSKEARLLIWYVVAKGTKGIFFRLPNNWENRDVIEEVKKVNIELKLFKNLLAIAEQVSLATCSQSQIEACTLQAGYDGIILILINNDTRSTPDEFTYKSKSNLTVKIKIPEGIKIEGINEMTLGKPTAITYKEKNGEIIIAVDKIDITREFLIKTSPIIY